MMCYRDKTFCGFHTICKIGYKCHRALTTGVVVAADAIGCAISQFADKPDCFEKRDMMDFSKEEIN